MTASTPAAAPPLSSALRWVWDLPLVWGKALIDFGRLQVTLFRFFSRLVEVVLWERPRSRRELRQVVRKQVLFTAVHALRLVGLVALVLGAAIVGGSVLVLGPFIPIEKLHKVIVFVVMRELAPLVVMLVVIARSGTAVAAELVTMKVNREIDLLRSLGISLEYYVVLPRVIGMLWSMVALVMAFSLIALLGGFVLCKTLGIGEAFDVLDIVTSISFLDLGICLTKALVFGLTISIVCCFFGLDAPRDFRFIPIQATRGVVSTLMVAFLLDIAISAVNIAVFGPPQVL